MKKNNNVKNLRISKRGLKEENRILVGFPSIDKPWEDLYTEQMARMKLPAMSCYRYVAENNKGHYLNTTIDYFGIKINYLKMLKQIDKVARAFVSLGVKKGDIVTICSPNTPEAIYMFYALSKIGAVGDMIDPRANENIMKTYLDTVNSKYLITVDLFFSKFKNILDKTNVEKVVTFRATESIPKIIKKIAKINDEDMHIPYSDSIINWQDFIKNGKKVKGDVEVPYEKDRCVAILHTGGTTGIPKGVMLTNDSLNALAKQLEVSDLHFDRHEIMLGLMPLFAGYGLGVGTHTSIANGMKTIPIPVYEPEKMADLVKKHHPTMIACAPAHWELFHQIWEQMALESKNAKEHDLSYLKGPIVGGDSINIKLEHNINDFFKKYNCRYKLIKGYGLTEGCAAIAVCMNDRVNEIGSVGIPLPGNNMSIFEPETGEELTYDRIGEICIQGPSIMTGYYEMDDETKHSLREHKDGEVWLHTGDLGHITKEGLLYFDGRLKRLIVRYDGCKVYPSEIERAVLDHPSVSNCVVVGIKDKDHMQGDLPKAVLVLDKDNEMDEEQVISEVKHICDTHIVDYAVPVEYEIKDELPRTGFGKIDFMSLKAEKTKIKTLKKD